MKIEVKNIKPEMTSEMTKQQVSVIFNIASGVIVL